MKILITFLLFITCSTPQVDTDLNRDGHLSLTDVVMFRLGLGEVDANMDGSINESDILFLRHYLAFRSYERSSQ